MFRFLALAILVSFLCACSRQSTDAEVQATIRVGDTIVAALKNYKENNQVYPESLDDLVPKYLASVPLAARGEEWGYSSFDRGLEFSLSYDWGGNDVAIFTNGGAGWAIDTK